MPGEVTIRDKQFRPLISEEQLGAAVTRIADSINTELANRNPVFLAVLNGSFIFAADLLRKIRIPCEISFIRLRSYSGTSSSGKVKEILGLDTDVAGRTVVIVEDIVDSGLTLETLDSLLREKDVAGLKVATLLFKPGAYQRKQLPDYIGFEVGTQFVVGYGMDYAGEGRNLSEIHVLA